MIHVVADIYNNENSEKLKFLSSKQGYYLWHITQLTFTCSKLTLETLKKAGKILAGKCLVIINLPHLLSHMSYPYNGSKFFIRLQ